MLAAILPKMTGFGALWRIDPVGVLAPETQLTHPKTSKVHAAPPHAATTAGGNGVTSTISKEKERQHAMKQTTKRSIHDRLRSIMGDMISEEELQQRVSHAVSCGTAIRSICSMDMVVINFYFSFHGTSFI